MEKIQFHEYMKIQSEKKIKDAHNSTKFEKELSHHNLMIGIWKRNEAKLRTQMSEMEEQIISIIEEIIEIERTEEALPIS